MVKKYVLHISACIITAVFFFSCSNEGKVIPRAKMAEIYAEMFITDQWLNSDYKLRRMADTSLVYVGIFEKYGYTVSDYRRSMEHYMEDPDRYARILKQSTTIIEDRIKILKKEKDYLKKLSDSKAATDAFIPKRIFYLSGLANKDLLTVDSLSFYIDSTGGDFFFDIQKGYDTLFAGPIFKCITDTLEVPDVKADSVSVKAEEQRVQPSTRISPAVNAVSSKFRHQELKRVDLRK